jgi:hypothetical protein
MVYFGGVMRVAAIAAGFAVVSSCATLDRDECGSVDWATLGEQDGNAGRAAGYISEHRAACERYNIPVDQSAWTMGWDRGIRNYCTAENGLSQGRQGRYYANSCPAEIAPGFERAYFVAKRVHDAQASRDRLDNELRELETQLRRTEDRDAQRELRREIDRKDDDLRSARSRLREAQAEYDTYLFTNNLARR